MNYQNRLQSALSRYASSNHPAAVIAAAHGVAVQDLMPAIEGVPAGEVSRMDDEPYVAVTATVANQIASVTGGRSGPHREQIAEALILPAPVIDAWLDDGGYMSKSRLRFLESILGCTMTAYEPIHPVAPDPITIPIHSPSTAPVDADDDWPVIGYTVAAEIGDHMRGIMIELDIEHWGIPHNPLLICADRHSEYNWLRLRQSGWTIAIWSEDLGWCNRTCEPALSGTDVAWSLGIIEIRRCMPPVAR